MTVVRFPVKSTKFAKQEEAWEKYAAASVKAQETLAIADGIAAGKAYSRFLALFVEKGTDGAA